MDFLKTLMLYMSLTLASSMQAAPLPEETPVPTAPPAVVETIAPAQDAQQAPADPAETPAPPVQQEQTAAPQASVPTITPNASYRNVKQGDRGDNVKRLQQRLIELGYLEEGSADGAFGGQTRKAVIAFQEANGLVADGVAGDATQTHLYENPNVKENPNRATPTPVITATPEPTAEPTSEPTAEPAAEPTAAPEGTIAPPAEAPAQEAAEVQREWLWQASIVYNDGGAPLACLRQEDGVTVTSNPRLYMLADGSIQLVLSDLAAAIEDWSMTADGDTITLNAAGYALTLSGDTCTVDGQSIALAANDVAMVEGETCISAALLEKALGAETIWDGEESTLIIRLQSKELAQATD